MKTYDRLRYITKNNILAYVTPRGFAYPPLLVNNGALDYNDCYYKELKESSPAAPLALDLINLLDALKAANIKYEGAIHHDSVVLEAISYIEDILYQP